MNREQLHWVMMTVLDMLNHLMTRDQILIELRKESFLKDLTASNLDRIIAKTRSLSYGILRQTGFTPSQNLLSMMNDIELARRTQFQIMNGGEEIDDATKLQASIAYLKSSIQLGQVRNAVGDKLKEEEKHVSKRVGQKHIQGTEEIRGEYLQPSELPDSTRS